MNRIKCISELQIKALTVELSPKPRFVEWILSLEEHMDETKESLMPFDTNIYLLPHAVSEDQITAAVHRHSRDMFHSECMDWAMDQSEWPEYNNDIFSWFEVICHSTISDLRHTAQPNG